MCTTFRSGLGLGTRCGDGKATSELQVAPFHICFHMLNLDRAGGSDHGHPATDSVPRPVPQNTDANLVQVGGWLRGAHWTLALAFHCCSSAPLGSTPSCSWVP